MCTIILVLVPALFFVPSNAIYWGEDAVIEDYPYMASYQIEYWGHYCGAVIISPQWLLTAGGCAGRWPPEETPSILAGSTSLTPENVKNNQTIYVHTYVLHPNYTWGTLDQYDLALVKLVKPLVFGDTIKAATIAPSDAVLGEEATFIGWGETNFTDWKRSPVLQSMKLPLLNDEDCRNALGDNGDKLDTGFFYCTGPLGDNSEKGPCFKDKGGPIVQDGQVFGIYMYAERCAKNPSLYIKLGNVTDWIQETILNY